jgi:hypothetical protein
MYSVDYQRVYYFNGMVYSLNDSGEVYDDLEMQLTGFKLGGMLQLEQIVDVHVVPEFNDEGNLIRISAPIGHDWPMSLINAIEIINTTLKGEDKG